MSSSTIRDLDDPVERRLPLRAARTGTSPSREAARIITAAVADEVEDPASTNLADAIAAIMDPLGGVELDIPARS